jgi:hypothetical protein
MSAKVQKYVLLAAVDISWWKANAKKKQVVQQQYGLSWDLLAVS